MLEFLALSVAFSLHAGLPDADDYNAIHPHIRYEQQGVIESQSMIAGAYLNSATDVSLYGGVRFEKKGAGLELGLVTGYEDLGWDGPVAPMIRTTYDVDDHARVYFSPAYDHGKYGAVIGVEILF